MRIIPIFEPYLYSFWYESEEMNEFERLFEFWNDPIFLEEFFETNKHRLDYYKVSVDQAIDETYKESEAFADKLYELSNGENLALDSAFRNLDNRELKLYELVKQKSRRRWLRIYAIRIDENKYVVTGGAIKLSKKMEDMPHTKRELEKLTICQEYLKQNGVFDYDSFKELLCEKL